MNKKFILTSILAISFAMPAVAKQAQKSIGGSTTCDTATLGQSENNSTANVEAKWFPNTIKINWYSDNEKLTVSNDAASCVYDGTITLPTQPTKTGYTFAGWRLVASATIEQCNAITDMAQCNNTPGCIAFEEPYECRRIVTHSEMENMGTISESDCEKISLYDGRNYLYCAYDDGQESCACKR